MAIIWAVLYQMRAAKFLSHVQIPGTVIWIRKILVYGGDVTDLYRISRLQFGVKSVVNTKT
ncbi:hypothetical protein B5F17_08995 [Butyricicoccus pullicaecorum]|uniref:Uncharacterized protein n=1 Tax=Butyricicoccus pullicaecorum TaxID=501571 RepID=A0A1Y4LMW7_9FIRM|nr:hypothetical protein B5F17_08995 [Butyricicoccus pullicaecorum]OUP57190.1 hypothetical protein B5F15_10265 [Butyricicoccus pullicaecorum]